MKTTQLARALALGLSTCIALVSSGQTPISDDFNQTNINTSLWTAVDPGGASGTSFGTFQTIGAGSGHSDLQIFVPAGDIHDAYSFNGALRLMQPVADTDFEVQAKFDSLPYQIGQEEGILVEDASGVALRIDAGLVTTAGTFVDQWTGRGIGSGAGAQISRVTMTDTPRPTNGVGIIYLRVKRQATQWTVWTSRNGADWIQRSSFTNSLVPAQVGIHAGNYSATATNAPAFTVLVDYFFNTASPIIPWDNNPTNVPLPSVSIASPGQNALLAANSDLVINVNASVLGGTITNVQVFREGTNLIGTATSSPFSVVWSNVPAGTYMLTATVTTDAGATRTSAGVKVIAVNTTRTIHTDDFSSPTINNAVWTPIDPRQDSQFSVVGAGSGESRLQISLPGTDHNLFQQNNGARLMQVITNQDFLVEAKFDSLPSQNSQNQGILIEDSNGVGLRFDAVLKRGFDYLDAWTGRNINTASAAQQAVRTLTDIFSPPPGLFIGTAYLRVQKQGDQWTTWTSPDGSTWTQNAFFTNTIVVARIGVHAGNAALVAGTTPPPYKCLVDYFMNLAAPISNEDGSSNSPPVVNLTSPTPGATFASTDTISLAATATEANGSIAKVEFFTWSLGMTDALLLGTDTSLPYESQLANPGPGTRYLFAKATASAGATAWSPIANILLFSGTNGDVVSDDFNAVSLNRGVWQIMDPVGNTSFSIDGAFTGDAHLLMRVPQGSTHDPYISNTSFQLLQTVASQPFEFVAKFDSIPSLAIQEQGFLVKDPTNNFLRWNVQSDTVTNKLRAFAARIRAGAAANFLDARVADIVIPTNGNAGTMYMKLNYDGIFFAFSTSPDGTNWTEQSSRPEPWTVSQVGIYVGNAGTNPAYTAWIDYFENTASPLTNEDSLVYPRLQIGLAGGQIVISWPVANSSGFNLETTTSLSSPSWTLTGGTPVVVGNQNTVTLPLGAGPSYYRLKK